MVCYYLQSYLPWEKVDAFDITTLSVFVSTVATVKTDEQFSGIDRT